MALAEEQVRGENELSRVAPLLACWVMKVASPTGEPKGSRVGADSAFTVSLVRLIQVFETLAWDFRCVWLLAAGSPEMATV